MPPGTFADSAAFRPASDGFALATHTLKRDRSRLAVVRLGKGSTVERVLLSGVGRFGDLAWSPDGRWLLATWPSANQWVFIRDGERRRGGIEKLLAVANLPATGSSQVSSPLKMHWRAMEPLIGAAQPRTMLEVGLYFGETTALLLEYAQRHDAVVHGIDTVIKPEVDDLAERYGNRLVLHRGTSLEELPRVGAVDVAILDGDHNYYTVLQELRLLGEAAATAGHDFPLTFLHDIGWPFGRRDQYHDPDSIPRSIVTRIASPASCRARPSSPTTPGLRSRSRTRRWRALPQRGPHWHRGLHVREPRAADAEDDHRLLRPGDTGLRFEVAANHELQAGLLELDSPAWLEEQCRLLEEDRWAKQARAATLNRTLQTLKRKLARLSRP